MGPVQATRRHGRVIMVAAAALTFVLGAPAAAAASTSTQVNYALPAVTAAPNSPCDVAPCQVLSYSFNGAGSAICSSPCPAAGVFSWSFTPSKYKTGSSCAFAAGSGSASIIWQDTSTTDVTFSFKARDAHTWSIKGQVTGGTNLFYRPSPNTVEGVVGFPPNPCDGGAVSATISLFPPQPA